MAATPLENNMSNEKKPGWLGYTGGYTARLYREYTTIRIPITVTGLLIADISA